MPSVKALGVLLRGAATARACQALTCQYVGQVQTRSGDQHVPVDRPLGLLFAIRAYPHPPVRHSMRHIPVLFRLLALRLCGSPLLTSLTL